MKHTRSAIFATGFILALTACGTQASGNGSGTQASGPVTTTCHMGYKVDWYNANGNPLETTFSPEVTAYMRDHPAYPVATRGNFDDYQRGYLVTLVNHSGTMTGISQVTVAYYDRSGNEISGQQLTMPISGLAAGNSYSVAVSGQPAGTASCQVTSNQ